jgi:hypothetical protein
MHPFWDNLYDDLKDRRYGMLFFGSLLAVLLSLGVLGALDAAWGTHYGPEILIALVPGIIILIIVWIWRWVRGRKQREEAMKYANLSRDELAKARSKLKRQMNFKVPAKPARRAAPRPPDTNLKY